MLGGDMFCTRIENQDRPRATRTGIVAKDEPRQEENLGPGNLFLLTGGGHIDVSSLTPLRGRATASNFLPAPAASYSLPCVSGSKNGLSLVPRARSLAWSE